jgi:hypothetical protein
LVKNIALTERVHLERVYADGVVRDRRVGSERVWRADVLIRAFTSSFCGRVLRGRRWRLCVCAVESVGVSVVEGERETRSFGV